MSSPERLLRRTSAVARLADLERISRREADIALAAPSAWIGDEPGWRDDQLRTSPPDPVRYLTSAQAAAAAKLTPSTMASYRSAGRFADPAAVLLPRRALGWLPSSVHEWTANREVSRGRPTGTRTMVTAPLSARRYLTASEAAVELGLPRSTVTAWLRSGEFPAHDALIGDGRVWLPTTIAEFRVLGDVPRDRAQGPRRYLSAPQVAKALGVSAVAVRAALAKGRIPPPDAVAGSRIGWDLRTVDELAQRPTPLTPS